MKTHRKRYRLLKSAKKYVATFNLSEDQRYTMQLEAQLFLDAACLRFNRQRLETLVNEALQKGEKEKFQAISSIYSKYVRADRE